MTTISYRGYVIKRASNGVYFIEHASSPILIAWAPEGVDQARYLIDMLLD